jgi:hypothetical protein
MSTEEETEHTVVEVGEFEATLAVAKDAEEKLLQEQILCANALSLQLVRKITEMHVERKLAYSIAVESLKESGDVLINDAKKSSAVILQDAQNKAEAILNGAAEAMNRWEAEKEALAGVQHFEQRVKLNIGSMRFETSLTTLRRFPDTMIGCMFSGRHAMPKGEDGYIFIDRDGTHFRHILNFLRSPEGYKPGLTGAEEVELQRECAYYGIDQLMFPPSPGTEISLLFKDLQGEPQGYVSVKVDGAGVHTIPSSGESIKVCHHCLGGIFHIGAEAFVLPCFNAAAVAAVEAAAAQPKVQGKCPACDSECGYT